MSHARLKMLLVAVLTIGSLPVPLAAEARDYKLLTHKISLAELRGGNHDESGTNTYFFKVAIEILNNTTEEKKKKLEERAREATDGGEIGDFTVDVLTKWEPPESEAGGQTLAIDGDHLRQLVSQAMRGFNASEADVAIRVSIAMYERGKRFWFFGEDSLIGETEYFPLPASSYQIPSRTNLKLSIQDETGAQVTLKVTYDEPATQPTQEKESAPSEVAEQEQS